MNMKMNVRFSIFTILIVLLICNTPLVTDAQLFDGEREGLMIGGGIGYAAIATGQDSSGESFSASGVTTAGRIGYGLSDQLTLYFSSAVPNLVPSIGVMYFADPSSEYYLQGLIGRTRAAEDSLLSIAGGFGFELRKYVTLEGMLGYNSFTDTYTEYEGSFFGGFNPVTKTMTTNIITLSVTFNVYFY